jgi:predicted component of type VI protein secretion system
VWAGGKLLTEDSAPVDPMPYVMFGGIMVPGRFWPTSVVEQLRPVQTELNKTRSQLRENAARIGNPAMLKNRLSNVDYTGLPGEVIEYDDLTPNAVPSYLQPPQMPSYVEQEIDWLQQSIQEISGQHEVSAGQAPPGVTAASAISLLQEQDDTRLGPDIAEMERAIGQAGEKVGKLIGRFYTDERLVRIGGDDADWDIFAFRGSMIGGDTKVSVQAGSAIPLSKAGKQAAMQQIITLFIQNGVPLSPRQLARFLKDMEVGGFERMVEQFNQDEQQVNSEHRRLAMGMALPINTYDNDEAHVELHHEWMKGARYQRLIAQVPQIAQVVEQHVALHQQRIQMVQEETMRQQVEMQKALQPDKPPAQSKSSG